MAQKERHCHFRSGGSGSSRRPGDSESFRESRTFSFGIRLPSSPCFRRGRRNVHARRMRYLITGSERSALAADSGAASVSYGVSEWALAWVSVSDCLKRRLWQLASELDCCRRSCRGCRSRGGCWSRSCSCRCRRGSSAVCSRCSSWTSRRRRCRRSPGGSRKA